MSNPAARTVPARHFKAPSANPVAVEVWRGGAVESRHRAAVAAVDGRGHLAVARGDVEAAVYPRSALKPVQVLPLIETGAADAFHVSDEELALACASHSGEARHVEIALDWLGRIGLDQTALGCGRHEPLNAAAAAALAQRGQAPDAVHNNCSGKHIAMLTTAVHGGEDVAGYLAPDHPVQRRVRDAIGALAGFDLGAAPVAVDGCSVPAFALPLKSAAQAIARLADPSELVPARAIAVRRILAAMAAHPFILSGTGRYCHAVIAATAGRVLVKAGAEGVMAAILPTRGLGVMLKVDDGAKRAAEIAMSATLLDLGVLDDGEIRAIARFVDAPVVNWHGVRTGSVSAVRPERARSGRGRDESYSV